MSLTSTAALGRRERGAQAVPAAHREARHGPLSGQFLDVGQVLGRRHDVMKPSCPYRRKRVHYLLKVSFMSIYNHGNKGTTVLAITPRNWEPVIGLGVALTLATAAPLMYLVAAGIRASYLPLGG